MVGCYYFKESEILLKAIEEQIERKIQLKGEYFLADAINLYLEHIAVMRTETVKVWLDAGTSEALLDTNRYMLEHGRSTQTVLLFRLISSSFHQFSSILKPG